MLTWNPLAAPRIATLFEILDDGVDRNHDDSCENGEDQIEEWCKDLVDETVDEGCWWEGLELWDLDCVALAVTVLGRAV